MNDLVSRNDASALNPNILNGQVAQIAQTVRGSDFYFAICAVMGTVAFGTLAAASRKPRTDRIFFYITAALNFTACIAYFTMGSNLGWAPIEVEFQRSDPRVSGLYRQVMYARYVDWVVTTPLLLMDLLLTCAMPWPTIIWIIFIDEVMIITGLIGALVSSRYKFGFFAFGCVAMFYIFWELAITGRKHAKALGADVNKVYTGCGVLTLFIWLLYPIAWGVSEGGNVIAPDSEAVFYGVLDFCAKPIFSILLIVGHWGISPSRLGLSIQEFGHTTPDASNNKEGRSWHEATGAQGNFDAEKQGHNDSGSSTADATGVNAANNTRVNNRASNASTAVPANAHSAHTTGFAPAHEGTTVEGHHTDVSRL
ncbi:hypothetical protein LTR05_004717 [Lithohypha guttulata]|uniref:Rhodopsin n=1 Tax=Lithohypha guttulata TaxID=1690604 RepID=A0AAN7SZ03_9EURO|nr:hypothetical protein LTR05_004717 [Lithohypha guttulata]